MHNLPVEDTSPLKPGSVSPREDPLKKNVAANIFTWGGISKARTYPNHVSIQRQGVAKAKLHTAVITDENGPNLLIYGCRSGGLCKPHGHCNGLPPHQPQLNNISPTLRRTLIELNVNCEGNGFVHGVWIRLRSSASSAPSAAAEANPTNSIQGSTAAILSTTGSTQASLLALSLTPPRTITTSRRHAYRRGGDADGLDTIDGITTSTPAPAPVSARTFLLMCLLQLSDTFASDDLNVRKLLRVETGLGLGFSFSKLGTVTSTKPFDIWL
ncbi:hypothetical protein BU17DRAFT_68019 [Hysterangium stoloniferum]|nr:hypothetical protein BU17DRAFT_68019 [Hysterangium stoloniferum]